MNRMQGEGECGRHMLAKRILRDTQQQSRFKKKAR